MLLPEIEYLEAVDEVFRELYKEADGKFVLDTDTLKLKVSDTSALKRAKDHEKTARQQAEAQAAALRKQLEDIEEERRKAGDDNHRKKGDVEALDKSWNEKYTKALSEKESQLEALNNMVVQLTADAAAREMANELAIDGGSAALYNLIRGRFGMEIKDGKPCAVALGSDGKPSALTLEELKAEIRSDKTLAALLAGSKATGGSANGGKGGGAAAGAKKASEMTLAEKSAYIAEHGLEAWKKLL
jgi:hypothetical protein